METQEMFTQSSISGSSRSVSHTFSIRWFTAVLLFSMAFFAPDAARAARQESGQTFDGPGGKLYYEVTGGGEGTPLLLVNGGPGFDHTYFHTTTAWDTLGRTRKVIFYDQRGNGRSAPLKPGQSCTLADQIDDLEALRAHLGFDKVDMLGGSWGGFLSMAYAARHPEHISHLILVDSAAPKWADTITLFDNVFPETTEREAAITFAEQLGDKSASDESIREYLSMIFVSHEKRDAFLAQIGPNVYNKEVNEAVSHDLARFDLNPEIRKFRFPTLVVTGRYDMNVAPLTAYRIHQAIPGSKFVVFERSSHLPFTEEPELFASTVADFLQTR
jgi:proline iminopeptidase